MSRNNAITIWHYADDLETSSRKVFFNASIIHTQKISKNGIKQKGFYMGDSFDIRIFTAEEIDAVIGDYLMYGVQMNDSPDREKSHKIIEVRDNRRGTNPHWRIICGG